MKTPEELARAVANRWEGGKAEEALVEQIAAAIREAVIAEHNATVLSMQAQLEDAVLAERERCACLVDQDWPKPDRAWLDMRRILVAAIREGQA